MRYLKFNIRSYYGSEFYCILSFFEVYGVDVVERMLEDLIFNFDNYYIFGEIKGERELIFYVFEIVEDNDFNN